MTTKSSAMNFGKRFLKWRLQMGNWWTKLEGPILGTFFGCVGILMLLGVVKALELVGFL